MRVPRVKLGSHRLILLGGWLLLLAAIAWLCSTDFSLAPYLTVVAVALTLALAGHLNGVRWSSVVATGRRAGFTTLAAAVVAVSLAAAVVRVPALVRTGVESAEAPRVSLATADLQPLEAYGAMQPIVWLEHVIPANATYTVLYGQQGEIPLLCLFWLQPRRYLTTAHGAAWVVTFYQALPPGLRYTRKVFFNPGIYAVEVKR